MTTLRRSSDEMDLLADPWSIGGPLLEEDSFLRMPLQPSPSPVGLGHLSFEKSKMQPVPTLGFLTNLQQPEENTSHNDAFLNAFGPTSFGKKNVDSITPVTASDVMRTHFQKPANTASFPVSGLSTDKSRYSEYVVSSTSQQKPVHVELTAITGKRCAETTASIPKEHLTDPRDPTDITQDVNKPRERKLTQKGYVRQEDSSLQVFKFAVANHKRQTTLCRKRLENGNYDVKYLTDARNYLENAIVKVSAAFHNMVEIDPKKYAEHIDIVNERETVNVQVLHELTKSLRFVEDRTTTFSNSGGSTVRSGTQSNKSKSHRAKSGNSCHSMGDRSVHSFGSQWSVHLKAQATANAAALETKLQFHQQESEHKAELERLKMLRKLAVEQAKIAALDDISNCVQEPNQTVQPKTQQQNNEMKNVSPTVPNSTNQINDCHSISAKCKFTTLSTDDHIFDYENKLESAFDKQESIVSCVPYHQGVDTLKQNNDLFLTAAGSNNNVPDSVGPPLIHDAAVFVPHVPSDNTQTNQVDHDPHHLADLFKSLGQLMSANRLPVAEPGVFSGDPLYYPAWKSAFRTLIENRGIAPAERIHYLQRYLGGDALKCVKGFLLVPSDEAYKEAMSLIDKRFGDSYTIACAFKSKIEMWPKIHSRDPKGLREFSDFLIQCEVASRQNPSLRVLNDDSQNRVMLSKLPDWLISRWAREVHKHREETNLYPPFAKFVKFLSTEADIACEPLTAFNMVMKSASSGNVDKKFSQSATGVNSHTFNTVNAYCIFCDKTNHSLDSCFKFMNKSLEDRRSFISDKKLCYACLKLGHFSKQCKNRLHCSECQRKHPTPLHGDVKDKVEREKQPKFEHEPETNVKTSYSPAQKASFSKDNISLMTFDSSASKSTMIVPVYISHNGNPKNEVLTYALLDTQSDTSFVTDHVLEALGVSGAQTSLMLSTMTSDDQLISCQRITGLAVRAYDKRAKLQLPALYSRDHIPANDDCIPSSTVADKWPYLRPVASQLMPKTNCGVGVLIGYNCPQALVPRKVIPPKGNGPFAQLTDLGWGIIGLVDSNGNAEGQHVCSLVSGSCIVLRTSSKEILSPLQVEQFFNLEEVQGKMIGKSRSQDDIKFMSLMEEQVHRTVNGHYELPLPLKDPNLPPSPNNKVLALQRLKCLVKRFRKDPVHHNLYSNFMKELFEKGYAEKVPDSELMSQTPAYYLPHHGVYNSSKPGKVRVVMDGSAKYQGRSLNDHLLVGPDLMNNLVGVLCRFREEKVAFTCDIQGMFQQFYVNAEHRNYLRFLWFEKGDYESQPIEYRSTVHLFGAASSPAVANFGLKRAALDHEYEFGSEVKEFVTNNFYMDDGLTSLPNVETAISLAKRSLAMCAASGLKLHKFVSNFREFIDAIPPECRSNSIKDLDLQVDLLPIERALGVQWCVESDSFKFRIVVKENAITRRGILSTVCSIFDPLGFIAPVVLQGKKLLQSLCKDKLDWDDCIPDSIRPHWERWLRELPLLESANVSRCFKPADFNKIDVCELHCFSDASLVGYGQCTYLRLKDTEGNVNCSLVMAKSRVAPLKTVTIPRLELTAAVLSTDVGSFLESELTYSNIKQVYWTDSKIVLGFIANDTKRFQIYVANRVQKIRDCSVPNQWHHVCTEDNPADIVSRGCSGKELIESNWFNGPQFLWSSEIQYCPENICGVELPVCEVKQGSCLANVVTDDPLNYFQRFSSWKRIVGIVAVCFRYIDNLKSKVCSSVQVLDRVKSANWLMLKVQQEIFSHEIPQMKNAGDRSKVKKDSRLRKLDPFIDHNGLIRVGGRLKQSSLPYELKHPIVLPKEHFLVRLLVQHYHESTQHQGKGMTINEVRSHGLWVLGLSSLASSLIYKCVTCRRHRHSPQGQKMSDLPVERLEPSPAFTHVAVDLFGPFFIREGRKELKRYGVLFTCLSSRAVHIETANTLDTNTFINALRRFLSIRGPIRTLRSDRGTNIVGAVNQLQKAADEIDDSVVHDYLLNNRCDYIFNVPNASHQGGVWERQIRSIRNVLSSMLHDQGHQLNDEGFRTLMMEAANIVNSRPLTVTCINDPCSLPPLTPNQLLTLKSNVILPPPGNFQKADIYSKKLWRRVQHLADEFWHRWKKEYLLELNKRSKWLTPKRNFQINDIVLIIDDSLPRCFWKLAKIVEVYTNKDGFVRKAKLQLGSQSKGQCIEPKFLERPISKLVLLLEAD